MLAIVLGFQMAFASLPDISGKYIFAGKTGESFVLDNEVLWVNTPEQKEKLNKFIATGYTCSHQQRSTYRCYKKVDGALPDDLFQRLVAKHMNDELTIDWPSKASELITDGEWFKEWLLRGEARLNTDGPFLVKFRKLRTLHKVVLQQGTTSHFEFLYSPSKMKRWVQTVRDNDAFWLELVLEKKETI